jgi:hypothetical protein
MKPSEVGMSLSDMEMLDIPGIDYKIKNNNIINREDTMSKKNVITKKNLNDLLEDLGPCLHTALRKHCDSKATSIAWNLINISEKGGWWTQWLEHLRKALIKDRKNIRVMKDFMLTIRNASINKSPDVGFDWLNFKGIEKHSSIAMSCALDLFDSDDWYCFTQMAYEMAGGKLTNDD